MTVQHDHHSEMRLRAVLDGVLDGIITINEKGIVESLNKAAERIFAYSAAEVIGNNVKMLMPEPYHGEHDGYLHNYCRSGIKKIIGIGREVVGQRKDGSTFPMELAVSEVQISDGVRLFTGIVRDITERKQAMQELNRFKGILDNTLDMIFMFDPETFRFVYLNKGTLESLGYTREELLNKYVWEIKPQLPEQAFRAHIAPLLNGDSPWLSYETLHRCKDGSELPVEVFLQLVKDEDGKGLFVAISRDLSERHRIDKLKSEFISTVSHELRTPLTSIRGALGLIRGGVAGELPTQVRPMIEIAYNNVERLSRLINDILDMEKIESGKMHFELQTVELMPLIEQALEANHAYAEEYRVRYRLADVLPGINVKVDGDRLLQVLVNLLSNAAKWSPTEDEVIITVKAAGTMARVEVTDNGPGIPEEFNNRIFQKFSQADSSDSKQKSGTGLGLSITKAIVEKMGGTIDFNSKPGQTTFYFELPMVSAPHGNPPLNVLVCETDDTKPRKNGLEWPVLLHVEDDSDLRQVLKSVIGNKANVVAAATLAEAKKLLGKQEFDLIVLDIGLPDGPGINLLPFMEQNKLVTPVLVFSAQELDEQLSSQVDAALVKSKTSNQRLLDTILAITKK